MAIRTEFFRWQESDILAMAKVGRYTVAVFPFSLRDPELCYAVLLDGMKVRCWTSADERTFPKKAAQVGTDLVKIIKNQHFQEATR